MSQGLRGVSRTRGVTPILLLSWLLVQLLFVGTLAAQGRSRFRLAEVRGQILPAEGEYQLPRDIKATLVLREARVEYTQDVRSGLYSFQDLGDGYYQLTITCPGYETMTEAVHVEGSLRGQVVIVNLKLGDSLQEGPFTADSNAGQTVQAERLQLPKKVREDLDKGAAAAADGRNQEAVRHYERALKRHPAQPKIWNNLGVQYLKVGKVPAAKNAFSRALEFDANDISANQNLALLLISQREFRQAIGNLQRLFQWLPEDMRIRGLLAEAYFQTGYYRLALTHFQKVAAERTENAEWLLKIGDCYTRLGKIQEAIVSLEKYLARVESGDRTARVRTQIERLRDLLPPPGCA